MIIRPFNKSDAGPVARLFHDTVRKVNIEDNTRKQVEAWAPEDLFIRDWATECAPKYTFIADDNNNVAGFAELKDDGQIDYFYCYEKNKTKGVGRALYRAVEAKAGELTLPKLYTEASITAKPFFMAMGFEVVKEQQVLTRGEIFINYLMTKKLPRES